MLSIAITGAFIAISFSAPPGPIAIETIRRGLRGGFYPALKVQLGSIIGDMTWCAVALLGLAPLVQVMWIRLGLAVLGVAVLIVLGAMSLRDAFRREVSQVITTEAASPKSGAFKSGLMISLANPMAVGYWIGIGGALIATGVAGTTPAETASFIGGFLAATFLWAFFMAVVVRWGKQFVTPLAFRIVTFTCGVALLMFGFTLASEILDFRSF